MTNMKVAKFAPLSALLLGGVAVLFTPACSIGETPQADSGVAKGKDTGTVPTDAGAGVADAGPRVVETTPCSSGDYQRYEGSILALEDADRDWRAPKQNLGAWEPSAGEIYFDDDGVRAHWMQERLVYHPVAIAQFGLASLQVYRTIGDERYLEYAKQNAQKLIDISLNYNNMLWFPYTFNFLLHGYAEEPMIAPWYSAMAQGQVLSLLIALNEVEPNDQIMEAAHQVFRSLRPLPRDAMDPWCTCVDEEGLIWFEEYPSAPPANTLNGKIFALYGLHDYLMATGNEEAEDLLRGGVETVRQKLASFRVEGRYSHYCLKHPFVLDAGYHRIHIRQIKTLAAMTGDAFFTRMAAAFEADNDAAENPDAP